MSNTTTTKPRLRNVGGTNWITGTVDGLEVQAKAWTEPSEYGMPEDGRISKLWVRSPGCGEIFNYDRGDDVNLMSPDDLAKVVAAVAKSIK